MFGAGQQTTFSTLDGATSIMCPAYALTPEDHEACVTKLTESYTTNKNALEEKYHLIYDAFVQLGTGFVYSNCKLMALCANGEADMPTAQCTYQAVMGEHIDLLNTDRPVTISGQSYGYLEFFGLLGSLLNILTIPIGFNDPFAGVTLPEQPATTEDDDSSSCTPTYTQIQACVYEHGDEGTEVILDCARQLCEEFRQPANNEPEPQDASACPERLSSAVLEAMPREEYERYLEQMQACHSQTDRDSSNPSESEQDGQVCRPPNANEIMRGATGPICQEQPPIQFEVGNPALTQENRGCNPFLGAPCGSDNN